MTKTSKDLMRLAVTDLVGTTSKANAKTGFGYRNKKGKYTIPERLRVKYMNNILNGKNVKTNVANAWSSYQSSKSMLDSIRSQVKAAEIANEGITQEYESGGNRTTLEVIQSRTILLNSRINLASSERNFLISKFNLLSTVGRLTAKHLNLNQ